MSHIPLPTDAAGNVKVSEQNPESTNYVPETLADVTDGTDGTYYYYTLMDSWRKGGWQLILDGGSGDITVTVEATIQDDGTAMAACTYADITSDVFGVADYTADALLIDNAEALAPMKYVRIKVVANSGSDDADWTIYHKRLY